MERDPVPTPLPDGRGDRGPKRARDIDETTVADDHPRLVSPPTPATRFLSAAGLAPLGPLEKFIVPETRGRDYVLSFALGTQLVVTQGATLRGLTGESTPDRVMLLDARGKQKQWAEAAPTTTLALFPNLDVAAFSQAMEVTEAKRRATLSICLEEWTTWLNTAAGARGPFRVTVACRAGHERSTAIILLAYMAMAKASGDGAVWVKARILVMDMARTLEPTRDTWGIGVVSLAETLDAMLDAGRTQLRPRPLLFSCASCGRETLAIHGLAHIVGKVVRFVCTMDPCRT
jgi:hypothetical protein